MLRLKSIRLAGFKSFVDPITLSIPGSLVGILGPNGCGKSNVIDAVKFVLGARSDDLRGDRKEDVIFNGSEQRKPLGRANVELVFDNSAHTLGGEYGRFSEIEIKREVSRDGDTRYFLNGTQCRRRDIHDVFLGTGLGPRSYAIIEQGTISKLIEAKPEELRGHIEEAAGISKYKERRRETESRIARTQENLDRLTDIRDEISRQLEHLAKQAEVAAQYNQLTESAHTIRIQLLGWRLQHYAKELARNSTQLKESEIEHVSQMAQLQQTELVVSEQQSILSTRQSSLHQKEQEAYQVGTEVVRHEQEIKYQQELHRQLQTQLQENESAKGQLNQTLEHNLKQLEQSKTEITQFQPEVAETTAHFQELQNALAQAEQALHDANQAWETFTSRAATTRQEAEVAQTRVGHLESTLQELRTRQTQLQETLQGIHLAPIEEEQKVIKEKHAELQTAIAKNAEVLDTLTQSLRNKKAELTELLQREDQTKQKLSQLQAEQTSLDALQRVALHTNEEELNQWLSAQGLGQNQRIAQHIKVETGYERAVEVVLGDYLEGVCVADFSNLSSLPQQFPTTNVRLFNLAQSSGQPTSRAIAPRLADFVQAPAAILRLIEHVFVCETMEQAQALLPQLLIHESVITSDGLWLSPQWLQSLSTNDPHHGVLARKQRLEQLANDIATVQEELNQLATEKETLAEIIHESEAERESIQQQAMDLRNQALGIENKVNLLREQYRMLHQRQENLQQELAQLAENQNDKHQQLLTVREQWQTAMNAVEFNQQEHDRLLSARTTTQQDVQQIRQQVHVMQQTVHAQQLRVQTLENQKVQWEMQVQSHHEQLEQVNQRISDLQDRIVQVQAPFAELDAQLQTLITQREAIAAELVTLREHLTEQEESLRAHQSQQQQLQNQLAKLTQHRQQLELQAASLSAKLEAVQGQMLEIGIDPLAPIELPEGIQENSLERQLNQLRSQIEAIGPVNLAAIDEFQTQAERKQYLDQQHEDLTTALTTLLEAIAKIDEETRERFKATFDQINQEFSTLFTKIFNGGQAALMLTEEDLLTAGVHITAQPPGKRNTSIHLLSGGEKALTAIALVFAIFQLNPAPFCLLDEVDAPLDDANVTRFCHLVKEMAEKVQVIYISHNKISMEMAEQLIGITMQEPGVSRAVAVDLNQAVEMAGAG